MKRAGQARPSRPTMSKSPPTFTPMELMGAWALGVLVLGSGWLWATAHVSTFLQHRRGIDLPFADMPAIAVAVAGSPGDPASAFPRAVASAVAGPVLFWGTGVALLFIPLVVAMIVLSRRGQGSPDDSHDARWATVRDLAPLVVPSPTPGRLTLGRGPSGRLLATEPGHSLLVLGPTQSGKTSGLAIPAILEWPGPVVATSVKADLLRDTVDARRRRGTVWVYDPSSSVDEVDGSTWTPLAACGTWQGSLRTATWMSQAARDRQMSGSEFWYANAAKLLAPLLFAAKHADLTMSDVVRWVDLQETDEPALLLKMANIPEPLAAATASWKREERARSSAYTTAENVLAAYADPAVAASAESCDFEPAGLLDGKANTLYVSAPVHEQARLRPLFTTLVQTVLMEAYEKAATDGRLTPPLLLVLDEAANIAPLRDLAQIASTAAGLGIQLVTVWQDSAQIAHRYGAEAGTVVNNHRAKLLLSGISDVGTTTELSEVMGDTTVTRRSTTVDTSGNRSSTEALVAQPLTTAAGLRQLKPFEGVLVYGHLPPCRLRLRPFFEAGPARQRPSRRR